MSYHQLDLRVFAYQLDEDGPGEEMDGEDDVATFREWTLPSRDFHGLWESLVFDSDVKTRLTRYAGNALLFSEREVDPNLIAWNRVVLLHGPPGTGKTTMCKALAQRLSTAFSKTYESATLVEVNAHSLFSRWFSESGKLVGRLFQKIQDLCEDEKQLVFVLVDEVESLAAARKAAASGGEPGDAIRVVNALLTQIDALKKNPNAMVLTTSNITEAIDVAFVDRADIKAYIGPPGLRARYSILHSATLELVGKGLVQAPGSMALPEGFNRIAIETVTAVLKGGIVNDGTYANAALLRASAACEGMSGRALRKLPFLAYAIEHRDGRCELLDFLNAIAKAVMSERRDREKLAMG